MSGYEAPPRRFNTGQKSLMYRLADGLCEECGSVLQPGWHGDHVVPYSRGGATHVDNGQALCPACNLKKGSQVAYQDRFKPRPFQDQVINAVEDGIATGRRQTIVLASPGSGKTLTLQAVATYLLRQGLIELVAVFTPRVALCEQGEVSWMWSGQKGTCCDDPDGCKANHGLFDPRARMGKMTHLVSVSPPLTAPGATGIGFISTYASLTGASATNYTEWAAEHKGRFLLVADEAQFCGDASDASAGTKTGEQIVAMHEHAAHTLLLTGTPYRSDGKKLVLCGDNYSDPGLTGRAQLVCHAKATYGDGVQEGYLREYEAPLRDARVVKVRHSGSTVTVKSYDLSSNGDKLKWVLRKPEVWQPLVDDTVEAVRRKQLAHPRFRGLIACIEQEDARAVMAYLAEVHPGVRAIAALSEDRADGRNALKQFKAGGYDVLVTVRMAFIGYDCPEITVVGVLTNYRDSGHLSQLVGRGMRVWDPKKCAIPAQAQSVDIIAPDDPLMNAFLASLEDESRLGVQEREKRKPGEPGEPDEPPMEVIKEAHATGVRTLVNGDGIDPDEDAYLRALRDEVGVPAKLTQMKKLAALINEGWMPKARLEVHDPGSSAVVVIPKTEKQQIEEIRGETADLITSALANAGYIPKHPDYQRAVGKCTHWVNRRAHYTSGQVKTVDQARARLDAAKVLNVWDVLS